MILLGEAAGRWLEPVREHRPRGMVATTCGFATAGRTESGVQAGFAVLSVLTAFARC